MITYKQLIEEIESYKGFHKAPDPKVGTSSPLHDLSKTNPEDLYSHKGAQYYGHGDSSMDNDTHRMIMKHRGKPENDVIAYRAVPKHVTGDINSGDWVTINKKYAKDHGEGPLKGNYKILEKKVKAKNLHNNGDSIHEFGYHE